MSIPGLHGCHHVGFTVPDMDEALAFFVEVLGCVLVHELPGFGTGDEWMTENLGVDPQARLERVVFLRCADGSNIELFQYSSPGQRTEEIGNADIGAGHIAIQVEDVHAAVAYLREQGVEVQGKPKHVDEGPREGVDWVYFRTPWGLQMELISRPSVDGALWAPA